MANLFRQFYKLFVILYFIFFCTSKLNAAEFLPGIVYQWNSSNMEVSEKVGLSYVVQLATGELHSLALGADGTVWAWGYNNWGQLGNGHQGGIVYEPARVKGPDGIGSLEGVISIAASRYYSMALKDDGTVWVWGYNGFGLRGTGDGAGSNGAPPILTPKQVKKGVTANNYLTDITAIAAGANHSLALRSDGTLLSWGANGEGQLGIGCFLFTCSNRFFPVTTMSEVKSIGAGDSHSIAVKTNGSVWGWGRQDLGALGSYNNGLPTQREQPTPIQINGVNNISKVAVKNHSNVALTESGEVFEWGGGRYLTDPEGADPRKIPNLDDIEEIATGHSRSSYPALGLAIKKDGTVWQWYRNNIIAVQIPGIINAGSIAVGEYTPNLAAEKYDPTPPSPSGPEPFLDLPWNYEEDGNDFSTAALAINSFFDHAYPLLSDLTDNPEPISSAGSVLTFFGFPSDSFISYSSHDGYDWGRSAKVSLGDDVLAAASGEAEFRSSCGACGNMIIIDHKNGYQTKYMHLLATGLITNVANTKINVEAGQKIGEVGFSGHVIPKGAEGAHIHFGVFQDKNGDGNFGDNFTDGATDPFGWHSNETDPWSVFEFVQHGVNKIGNKSYYLWKKKIENLKETLTTAGGTINLKNFEFIFPEDATTKALDISMTLGPIVNPSKQISSIGNRIIVFAYDKNGSKVTTFAKPFSLTIDFSNTDLTRYLSDTISIYSSTDGIEWNQEPTIVDLISKRANSQINHLTHFALLAERKDTIAPITTIAKEGDEGQNGWFRSNVSLTLFAEDNDNGLGVDFTSYSKDESDWEIYENALDYTEEGKYKLDYYSVDNDENIEEIKTFEFNIDKTPPTVTVNTDKAFIWPPNGKLIPILITGSATDDNLDKDWVIVTDEYGELSPILTGFGETIYLPASRREEDMDGRKYTITAKALDMAGNLSSKASEVIVLHDQRN